jgi:EmrB/QacA subfamily drug resistance transporter
VARLPAAPGVPPAPEPTRARARGPAYKWVALSNTTLGTLMAALDTNIVIIALPSIGRELPQTSPIDVLWILLGYALVTAVFLLSFGRLSDQFGRTRLYTAGFAVFTLGSALCALSQTGAELVAFRMVQSVGAAFLFANSAAILTDAFPPHERGRALGVNQISIVVGAVSGLLLGGVLTGVFGWRSIFFVNVPIGIFATVWAHYRLRELAELDVVHKIDWAGNVTFGAGLAVLLVGITFGALGALGTLPTVGLFAAGIALLVLFALVERRSRHPMFDLSLFRIPVFTGSGLAMLLNSLARGAFSFVIVFYLQGPPRFLDPLTAGLYLVPLSASIAVFGPISGAWSDRLGSRPFAIVGLVLSAAGFFLLATIGPDASFTQLLPDLVLIGSGLGIFASPNRASMMSSVPPRRRGVAAGIGTTFMNAGQTLSLGLAVLVISRSLPVASLSEVFTGAQGSLPGSFHPLEFLAGVHLVFFLSGILLLLALVPSALRPENFERPPAAEPASEPA